MMRGLAICALFATPVQAQVDVKIAAMVDRFFEVCPLALDDPHAYAATLQVPGAEGQRVAANSPDGQVLWVVDYADGVREDVTISVAGTEQIRHCNMIHSDLFLGSSAEIAAALKAALAAREGVVVSGGVIPHDIPVPGASGVFDGGFERFDTTHHYMFTGGAEHPGFAALAIVDEAIELYSFRTISTGAAATASARDAADPGSPEQAMRLVTEICITRHLDPQAVLRDIRAAGFTLDETEANSFALDGGSGVLGYVEISSDAGTASCSVQSTEVPLDAAMRIGTDLATRHYTDAWQPGHPEHGMPTPCSGLSIFAPQRLIWLSYADAGNGGTCDGSGGSAIFVNM